MGIYVENYRSFSRTEQWSGARTYRQPAWRHFAGAVVHKITMAKPWIRFEELAERPLARLHRRRCNFDCTTGKVSHRLCRPPCDGVDGKPCLSSHHPDHWDTRVETFCGRLSFGASVDMWCFDFSRRGRVDLSDEPGPRTPRVNDDE